MSDYEPTSSVYPKVGNPETYVISRRSRLDDNPPGEYTEPTRRGGPYDSDVPGTGALSGNRSRRPILQGDESARVLSNGAAHTIRAVLRGGANEAGKGPRAYGGIPFKGGYQRTLAAARQGRLSPKSVGQ